jgi:iron(III) transport system ATP-binding protein
MARLVVTGVHKRLGGNPILNGVSLELGENEVVALLGPSGSGKTTLLRAVAGLEVPDQGRIVLGDEVLFDAERGVEIPAERRHLGLVFQSYALWPHRTVFENVAYGLKLRKVPAAEIRARVVGTLDQLGLRGLADRHPHQLSGGQQQRVALARAIVYEPRVLLLDEPLSNLDAKLREEARAWLRQLIEKLGISAVCVTHDQVEALALADRILLLDQGRIVQEGSPEQIYAEPASAFAAEFMGANNRLRGKIAEVRGDMARVSGPSWEVWGRLRARLQAGEPATAIIRIEKTRVQAAPAEGALPAKLDTALFLGERWDYVFTVGDQRVRAWEASAPRGESHWLVFPPQAVWVFGEAADAARAGGGTIGA